MGDRIGEPGPEESVDLEVQHHIQERADRLVAEGWATESAMREATRLFGDVRRTRAELVRMGRRGRLTRFLMASLGQILEEIRFAARSLTSALGFSITVILTLGLCIGANATALSALHDLVLDPVALRGQDRLVQLFNLRDGRTPENRFSESSWNQYEDLRDRAWAEGAALRTPTTQLIQHDGAVRRLAGQSATADLFDLMGIEPVVGRFFTTEEVDPGPGLVVVLSQTWWEEEFGADPDVVGERLQFGDGAPYTVIGIAPRSLEVLDHRAKFTIPLRVAERDRLPGGGRYQARSHDLWIRLAAGVSQDAALQQVRDIERRWLEGIADDEGRRIFESYDGRVAFDLPHPLSSSLFLFQGASLLVLLAGCFNITVLFVIRSVRRRRELSIRQALGASRFDLGRLFLIEGVVLGVAAGFVALLSALEGTSIFNGYLDTVSPSTYPIDLGGWVSTAIVMTSIVIVVGVGVLSLEVFGRGVLGDGSRGGLRARLRSGVPTRFGGAMASVQIALAFPLLVSAALLLESFRKVAGVDPGFAADQVIEGRLDFESVWTFYPSRRDAGSLKSRIVEAMRDIPGVESVGLSMFPMLSHDMRSGGAPFASGTASGAASYDPSVNYVSPGFFATMGIPIRSGRPCAVDDTPQSIVVDELLAVRVFGDADPVGLEMPRATAQQPVERVIGLSGRANLRGPEQYAAEPIYYRCEAVEAGWWEYSILLRTSREPDTVIRDMQDELRRIDPRLPLSYSGSLGDALDDTVVLRRAVTVLASFFAGVAVVLSLLGVSAVLVSHVVDRRREIGIRVAVGARPADVLQLVMMQGLKTSAIGLALGAPTALALGRWLSRFLFETDASDARIYLGTGGLFVVASALASLVPARHAAGVDPLESVREA